METSGNIVYDNGAGLVHNDRSPAQLLQGYPHGAYTTLAMNAGCLSDLHLHIGRLVR